MNRSPSRFVFATLAGLATLLLPGVSRAQGLTVSTPNYATSGPQGEISFELAADSSWAGKDTFLVCYASVADDDHEWSKTLEKIVGAVSRIEQQHDLAKNLDWAGGIAGVTATAATGTYTVPRSLISKLATEVNWSSPNDFVEQLGALGTLAWPTDGWPSTGGSSMKWKSLGTTPTSNVFYTADLMHRCFTLQVASWLGKPENDETVVSYVNSMMDIYMAEMIEPGNGANFDLNIIAVQIDAGGGSPVIKLSLPHKVRITTPYGGGGGTDGYLMISDAFPCAPNVLLRARVSHDPNAIFPDSNVGFFLPIEGGGYMWVPAMLVQLQYSLAYQCQVPENISQDPMAPFMLWDATNTVQIPILHNGPNPWNAYLLFTLAVAIF